MEPTTNQAELAGLTDAAVEGRLTPEQRERLERLVLSDPAARRWYVERLHLNACLHWSAAEPEGLAADHRPGSSRPGSIPTGSIHTGSSRPARPWTVRLRRTAMALLAAAAVLAVSVGPAVWWGGEPAPATSAPVATLTEAKGCRWEAGTLPTAAGARLTAGRLRLAEGLARLVFERGAEVTLEGPADLELVSADRCVLHSGRLVARVPTPAVGFVVDTPTAVLRDLGTEFGVSVAEGRAADVQVFSGIVDAEHRGSGRTERMLTGRNLRFTDDAVAEFAPGAEPPPAAAEPPPTPPAGKVLLISTAQGRGKDAYVQQGAGRGSDLLLVKNASGTSGPHNRKTYVGFDLSALAGRRVLEAAVSFAFAPSGLGFASEVPDATFAVYGLTDESGDDWAEKDVRWGNAPANRNGGAELDPDRVVKLGTFTLAQGEQRGTRTVSGPALAEFLNRDTNGLATLIVVRETPGSGRSCLVHGIAAKGHPSLPPPTLTLTVERP